MIRAAAVFILLLTFAVAKAGAPKRESGLSVHMLPDRVAKLDGRHGGFSVRRGEAVYANPDQLLVYFESLPIAVCQNGIWVVTTNPTAYSKSERDKLRLLIDLCSKRGIAIFTCRGAELPNGWKRSEVPTGWNDGSK